MMQKSYKKQKIEHNHNMHNEHTHMHHHIEMNKNFWIKNIVLAFLYIYFIIINILHPQGVIAYTWHYGIWMPITTYVVFWEGRSYLKIYKKIAMRIVDMDTLIGLAAHILYLFSIGMVILHWKEPITEYGYPQMWEGAAILIIITNIGHALSSKIQKSSLSTYEKLHNMLNSKVIKIVRGHNVLIAANKLKIGDTIIVKKGDLVPIDGVVATTSRFNYSNITGESHEVLVNKGKVVISGAYNSGGAVQIKVTKSPVNSTLSVLVNKIEDVSLAKPNLQKLADKILRLFIPGVLLTGLLSAVLWTILGYTMGYVPPWIFESKNIATFRQHPWIMGITAGVTVLAIACPCALGIATPLVYTVSSLLSAEKGIMINEPKVLEEIDKVKYFAFDKTGTITNELFEIKEIVGNKKYISVAKGLEQNIKHPIAQTIMNIKASTAIVKGVKHLQNGIVGQWDNKKIEMKSQNNSKSSTTDIALYINGKEVLLFKLKNTIKDYVVEVMTMLKNKGITPVMITGDNKNVALDVAKRVGIEKVFWNVQPSQKSKIINDLQKTGKVAFVGDGFNDSVAIKQANVSLAFASGSDITNSLADISLLRNNFNSIINTMTLAKMNNSRVKIALTYAFAFNMITVPAAFIMLVAPWVGATIMALSDILVATNAVIYRMNGRKRINNN